MENPQTQIKEELQGKPENQIQITDVNILFLDISSSCTGYAIANVNFESKSANIIKAGCLWLDDNWSHQEKYSYMWNVLSNYFWIVDKIDYIVVEQYSVNPRKMVGVNVVSEMQGAIKAGAWENGVKVTSILPQTWRAALSIKPNITKNSSGKTQREFKQPTKDYILSKVVVPDKVISNVTKNERSTPSDVYDALGICLGWLTKFGIKKIISNNVIFNSHIGALNE